MNGKTLESDSVTETISKDKTCITETAIEFTISKVKAFNAIMKIIEEMIRDCKEVFLFTSNEWQRVSDKMIANVYKDWNQEMRRNNFYNSVIYYVKV